MTPKTSSLAHSVPSFCLLVCMWVTFSTRIVLYDMVFNRMFVIHISLSLSLWFCWQSQNKLIWCKIHSKASKSFAHTIVSSGQHFVMALKFSGKDAFWQSFKQEVMTFFGYHCVVRVQARARTGGFGACACACVFARGINA